MRKICKRKHAFKYEFKNIVYIILIIYGYTQAIVPIAFLGTNIKQQNNKNKQTNNKNKKRNNKVF